MSNLQKVAVRKVAFRKTEKQTQKSFCYLINVGGYYDGIFTG